MSMFLTTFPNAVEFEKARKCLNAFGARYEIVSPSPGYDRVGVPAVMVDQEERARLAAAHADVFMCSGWVDYRPPTLTVPASEPPGFAEDIFGR